MSRLGREVEKAKIALSTHQDTTIWLDELCPGMNIRQFLTRAQFEEMTESLVCALSHRPKHTYLRLLTHRQRHQTMATITDVLRDQNMSKESIDDVLLVGGSGHIPSIRTMLEAPFPDKIRVNDAIQPDEAVVHGAAIQVAFS